MFLFNFLFSSVLVLTTCFGNRNAAGNNDNNLQDTVVIAKEQQNFTLSKNVAEFNVQLRVKKVDAQAKGNLLLQIGQAHLLEAPDGVYEVYLSKENVFKKNVTSSSSNFLGVIDIYLLTGSNAAKNIYLNVPEKVMTQLLGTDSEIFVTVLFRGNLSANGTESNDAGRFSAKSIALIKVK